MFLIDRSDPGGLRQQDLAAERNEIAEDQPKERRFPDAVAPDQPDLGPGRQRNARGIEKSPTPSVKDEILDPKHIAGARGLNGWWTKGRFFTPPRLR
jgi:hypothetical protein